jgi:GT2 family glycosyltransferase
LTLGSDKNNLSPPVTVLNKTTTSVKTNLSKNNYSFIYKKSNLPQTALFESTGNFFNSVLLPLKVFRDVGYPNAKYFIWGDENDFLYRCWERGYIVKVVKASEVFTNNFINYKKIKIFNHAINIPNLSDKKLYFMIRNSFILNSKYNLCKFPRLRVCSLSFKHFVFELFFAKKNDAFRRCKLIVGAFFDTQRMLSGKKSNGFKSSLA